MAFRLAPRINAAGRMDVASEVVELFTTRDAARAAELAAKLERLNRERRETEASALTAIEKPASPAMQNWPPTACWSIDGDGWHRGVIGILASRVVERTAKPAIVVSVEDGVAHGSGRSVDGFQLLNAIESCADLFTRFGGHAFAVGFALPADALAGAEAPPAPLRRGASGRPRAGATAAHPRRAAAGPHHARAGRLAAQAGALRPRQSRAGLRRPPRAPARPAAHHEGAPHAPGAGPGFRPAAALARLQRRSARRRLESGRPRLPSSASTQGSLIDLAYRIRENDHPEYGGLEAEIAGIELA